MRLVLLMTLMFAGSLIFRNLLSLGPRRELRFRWFVRRERMRFLTADHL